MRSAGNSNPHGACSQVWIPAIEQAIPNVLTAPFDQPIFGSHYALICTATATKDHTMVYIGDDIPIHKSGGAWYDNLAAGMSFYNFPIPDYSTTYLFSNPAGIIVLGYGLGGLVPEHASYYYLAGSAMRDLSVAFFVNDIHYQELDPEFFCENEFRFRAEVENIGVEIDSLKWFLNEVEETAAQNQYSWNKTLAGGDYVVTLAIYPHEGEPKILEGILHVNAHITATPVPETGGTVNIADTCIKLGKPITLIATPNTDYVFVNWTNGATLFATTETLTFTVTGDLNLNANFKSIDKILITLTANPPEGGTVVGGGEFRENDPVTVTATPNSDYNFVNWTEDNVEVSSELSFTFLATEDRVLIANFNKILQFVNINIEANDSEYGFVNGSGLYEEGTTVEAEAIVYDCYRFKNWSIDSTVVSTNNPYLFPATENINLTANFYALDFDDYTHIFWNNTFMLDMKKLADEGYEPTACKWYKNGMEEPDTRTINEFSYSLGTKSTDLFDFETAIYKWQIHTKAYGDLCSSNKSIEGADAPDDKSGSLLVYPNPLFSGTLLTITGAETHTSIMVYNALGVCVGTYPATEEVITLTLNFPAGVYWVKNGGRVSKTVVVK
jgi:uncharacterized repeat protein (TIGR02543 family)